MNEKIKYPFNFENVRVGMEFVDDSGNKARFIGWELYPRDVPNPDCKYQLVFQRELDHKFVTMTAHNAKQILQPHHIKQQSKENTK